MKPDFDHIKKLWDTFENTVDPGISRDALNQLRALLPRPLFAKLNDGDFDDKPEEFERAFNRLYDSKPEPEPEPRLVESPDDLLPFAGFPKYALDTWGRPHGLGGQGQKRGPLTAIKQWKPRKGQKPRFIFGYSLYRDGKRVFRSATICAMARSNAERGPEYAAYWAARECERLQGDTEVEGATEK